MYYVSCAAETRANAADRYFAAMGRYLRARTDAQSAVQEALSSETATPPRDPLGVSANIYAFRGERETELVAYVFVPAGELRSTRSADGHAMYALEALFAPGDPVSQRVVRADTTIVFTSPRPLPKDATVGTAVALEMPPMELARLTVGVTNRNDRGQG
ncbi:MAG: hypothetical protein DIU52_009640 [bacterium]|jgi:hypothetical protein|nr:MAG: hypothetical protein DIU52_00990 [bacterium]